MIQSLFFLFLFTFILGSPPGHTALVVAPPEQESPDTPHHVSFLAHALQLSPAEGDFHALAQQVRQLENRWGAYHASALARCVGYYFHNAYTHNVDGQSLNQRLTVASTLLNILETTGCTHPTLFSYAPLFHTETPSYWAMMYIINTYLPTHGLEAHRAAVPLILDYFHELGQDYNHVLFSAYWANAFFTPAHHTPQTFLNLARRCHQHLMAAFGNTSILFQLYQNYQTNPWPPEEVEGRVANALAHLPLGDAAPAA